MAIWRYVLALCLVLPGCGQGAADNAAASASASVTLGEQSGDLAPGPAAGGEDAFIAGPIASPAPTNYLSSVYWPSAKLDPASGTARISCSYDYERDGDGRTLNSLEFFAVVDAMNACRENGVVRLRYKGKIGTGFTALVERVGAMAERMEIGTRILDIDSAGGHVEEAILAGDAIAESHWAIWVREDALCHSACVLVLAAGDTRSISGKVGIHRLMRDRSNATSRAELNAELKQISQHMRDYLERNGVAVAIADQMMTIPNRQLRLLSEDDLKQYGLYGTNAAQDDLDRIRLNRQCGEDFVRRRDSFRRAFDRECMEPGEAFEDMNQCGLALQSQFGFPDRTCPDVSPMSDQRRSPARLPALPPIDFDNVVATGSAGDAKDPAAAEAKPATGATDRKASADR